MAKLKELIDQHRDQVLGLKVRRDHWEKFGWLEILDIRNGNAIGWNNYGGSTVQALDSATENWELYQPPVKPKRKVTAFPVYATQEAFDRFLMQAGFSLNKDYCMQVEVDD